MPGPLSPPEIRKLYNRIGAKLDTQAFYENPALHLLVEQGSFDRAQAVFEFGCGTGRFAATLLGRYLSGNAAYCGLDVSETMVRLARERLEPWRDRAKVELSDGRPCIASGDSIFDRFISTYVFDLLTPEYAAAVLREAHRILLPGGLLCLTSLTEGTTLLSRTVVGIWKTLYGISPKLVGGCRPIDLLPYLRDQPWQIQHRSVVLAFGVGSQVVVARRD